MALVLPLCGLLAGCGGGGADDPVSGASTQATVPTTPTTPSTAFAIATETLPNGQPDTTYPATQLSAVNAAGAVTWNVEQGSLPVGLSLTPTGVLAGNTRTAGFHTVTIGAQCGSARARRTYALSIGVFGMAVTNGLVGRTAWSGTAVTLSTSGASGGVRFEVLGNDSGGALVASDGALGKATWLPGPHGGLDRQDRLEAVDTVTGSRASVTFDVQRDLISGFAPAFGSADVWYVDLHAKVGAHAFATDFHEVLAATGLRSPTSTARQGTQADELAELAVRVATHRWLNLFYGRNPDGTQGTGLPITFAFFEPQGFERPGAGSTLSGSGQRYSVMSVLSGSRRGILGTAFLDSSANALHENDTTSPSAGELGLFANQFVQTFNLSYNNWSLTADPVDADDLPALEAVLYGAPSVGGRCETLRAVVDGLGRTLAIVAAHEIGHSLGLPHTSPTVLGSLMNASAVLAPNVACAFLPSDMAALRARLPGTGRFSTSSPRTKSSPFPEGGIAVCADLRERCDLEIDTSTDHAAPARPAGVPAWAVRVR